MIKSLYQRFVNIIWYIMLFLLPITSMPLVARLLGSDTVASPSILFLALLAAVWFIPYLFNRGKFPNLSVPLIFFIVCALISTLAAVFIEIPAFKDFSILESNIQSFATLFIGAGFYFISANFPKDEKKLSIALQVVNWSGFFLLFWAFVQAISWFGFHRYPRWMFDFQGIFSSRVLYHHRVTGFALEPSWLAHELNMLFLPLWLAASIKKYSSHDFRVLGFSFENLLLVGGIAALVLTLSRVGYLAFLFMITLFLIHLNIRLVNFLKGVWSEKIKNQGVIEISQSRLITIIVSVTLIACYLILLVVGAVVLSKTDPRMKDLFDFSANKDNPILSYFNTLQFGERAIYWLAGWDIFNDYPVLGIGLGNAGFFFPQKIIPYGWTLIEVRRLMYRLHVLLNIKNLWIRLLAETGIVGFSVFVSWIVLLFFMCLKFIRSKNKLIGMLALTGIFVLIALPAEGFSVDSFALPFLWVSLGLVTAGLRL